MTTKQINCIVDTRVSDDKQLLGNGLNDQWMVCSKFVTEKGWNMMKLFDKSHSGRKVERGDFEEVIEYIKEQKKKKVQVHFYVVKSIDRFTRNGAISYTEMKDRLLALDVQLIDTYGIIQPTQNTLSHLDMKYDWSVFSPSETSELVEAVKGKSEVRDILSRLISSEITQTRQGYSMREPNDGYINVKAFIDSRKRSVIRQDEKRAEFYKIMFRMRALGSYSDKEIVEKVNSLGYRSKPQQIWSTNGKEKKVTGHTQPRVLTVKQLQKVIMRTMYAGVKKEIWNKDSAVWAVFEEGSGPITSIDEFNKANRGKVYITKSTEGKPEVLYDFVNLERNTKIRKKYSPSYSYDKMVSCEYCGKPLKNSGKGNTGKSGKAFQAYHCDRQVEGLKHYYRVPKNDFENQVENLLNRIVFSDSFSKKLEERLVAKFREREKEVLGNSIVIGENVTTLKREQASLMDDFSATSSQVLRKKLEEKIEDLEKRINKATEQRDKIEIEERDIKSFVKYAKDLVEHPVKMLANNKNPYTQSALFDLVFDSPLTYAQIINGTPKLSFIFKLSDTKQSDKSAMVTLRGIEPRLQE
jgi:site-specific DNA recombinase